MPAGCQLPSSRPAGNTNAPAVNWSVSSRLRPGVRQAAMAGRAGGSCQRRGAAGCREPGTAVMNSSRAALHPPRACMGLVAWCCCRGFFGSRTPMVDAGNGAFCLDGEGDVVLGGLFDGAGGPPGQHPRAGGAVGVQQLDDRVVPAEAGGEEGVAHVELLDYLPGSGDLESCLRSEAGRNEARRPYHEVSVPLAAGPADASGLHCLDAVLLGDDLDTELAEGLADGLPGLRGQLVADCA